MSQTLKIIAHGDSWFDYPRLFWTGGGIPRHLSKLLKMPIQNLAHHGDGTEQMLSIRKRKELEAALPGADILLFSGGGNDIAGDQFCIWLNDNIDGNVHRAIDRDRFDKALDLIIATYNDLVLICMEFAPDCLIVTHGYDFPPPLMLGVGIFGCHFGGILGPWLRPSIVYCGWTDPKDQSEIIKIVLKRFNNRMIAWSKLDPAHRLHVPTQGILTSTDWANELHPNYNGFEKHAAQFRLTLQTRVPLMRKNEISVFVN